MPLRLNGKRTLMNGKAPEHTKCSVKKMLLKSDAAGNIRRWIALANLLGPEQVLFSPEVVAAHYHPGPSGGSLRRAWLRRQQNAPLSAEAQVLEKLSRAFQEQFGKPSGERIHSLRNSRLAREVAAKFAERERQASIEVEVAFLERRGRGRPRKHEPRPGLVTRREQWRPPNKLDLYRLFYCVRKCLDAIADSHLGMYGTVDLPATGAMFIAPDGSISVFRGISDGFLVALLSNDPTRVRRCPICRQIFYAWRQDKGACSPRCCDAFSSLKYRNAAKRHEYERNRKINRERKKAREELHLRAGKRNSL